MKLQAHVVGQVATRGGVLQEVSSVSAMTVIVDLAIAHGMVKYAVQTVGCKAALATAVPVTLAARVNTWRTELAKIVRLGSTQPQALPPVLTARPTSTQ